MFPFRSGLSALERMLAVGALVEQARLTPKAMQGRFYAYVPTNFLGNWRAHQSPANRKAQLQAAAERRLRRQDKRIDWAASGGDVQWRKRSLSESLGKAFSRLSAREYIRSADRFLGRWGKVHSWNAQQPPPKADLLDNIYVEAAR